MLKQKNHQQTNILEKVENIICDIVPENSRVLDLGCGEGRLLKKLQTKKNVTGVGIEINEKNVITCISNSVSVCQCNIDEGLRDYADKSFDYVILNYTIQEVFNAELVINEMIRVGKKIIIGFANFAFWEIRFSLFLKGLLPKTTFYPYEWYNTPNIRLITIVDFINFCKNNEINIVDFYSVIRNTITKKPVFISNLLAKYAFFICQQ